MTDVDEQPEGEQPPPSPLTGMVATGHAEIIRNGQVVTDEPDNEEQDR